MSNNKLFEIANNFVGWGDPKCGIWFVGIEEAASWNEMNKNELFLLRGKKYIPEVKFNWKELGSSGRGVRDYMSKICYQFSDNYKCKSWRQFRDENLWAENSQVFQTNLFPIGKASLKIWPKDYEKLFGFGDKDRDRYYQEVMLTRLPVITSLWEECRPQATICFGKSFWNEFKTLFDVIEKDIIKVSEDVQCEQKKRIIFSPFFGQGMSDKKVRLISGLLQDWGVSIY
jgi:hypothetical protein